MKKPDVMSEQIRNLYEYVGMLRNYFEVHSWSRQQTKYDSDFIADINHKLMALCNKVYVLTQVDIAECESQIQQAKKEGYSEGVKDRLGLEDAQSQRIAQLRSELEQAKAEVAREMFEEIEKNFSIEGHNIPTPTEWDKFIIIRRKWQSLKDRFLKDVKNGNR